MAGGAKFVSAAVVSMVMLVLSGCIAYVVPVDSWESNPLENRDFEQHLGSGKVEVLTDIGEPTYILVSIELNESYYLYERKRFVKSEWGHYELVECKIIPCDIRGDSGRFVDEDGKSCYLLVFDANDVLVRQDSERIRYAPGGPGDVERVDVPGNPLRTSPELDCREFYWSEEELSKITVTDTLTDLKRVIRASDADTAFELYQTLSDNRKTIKAAWVSLCKAANNGHAQAQLEVGLWHRTSVWKQAQAGTNSELQKKLAWIGDALRIQSDDRIAYMWYTLAETNSLQGLAGARDYIADGMTPAQIAQAEQLAHDWKPGDCPSATNQLRLPEDI